QTFLFIYYGLILQAEGNSATVRTHLQTLLGTSHQWPKQREGIALTLGLAATRHLDDVWAVLDRFGRSTPIKCSLHSFSQKDEILKQSFLSAILMLMGAIHRDEGAHSYEFAQTSKLLECLMVLMEKEPQDTLCTLSRQQTINIISSLCELPPPLDFEKKSKLLSTCFRSVFALPLLDVLEKHSCLFLEPPNIKTLYNKTLEALDQMLHSLITQNPTHAELHFLLSHMYVWLASEKSHERQRAVSSCTSLLKFLSHNLLLDPKENFKRFGQLVGMLGVLCQDPDKATQNSSLEGLCHLHQLLMYQKDPLETMLQQEKNQVFQLSSSQVIKVKALRVVGRSREHLTVGELNDLLWTAINSLGSNSSFCVQAAAEMLLAVIQDHGAKLKTVANMGRAIHIHLCSLRIPQAKENALRAITLLARSHTPELVAAFLDFSIPLDRCLAPLWKALGTEQPVSHLVLAILLAWLQQRPLPTSASDSGNREKTYLRSLAAMNTLHELQFAREFKNAVQEAYPQLLLALVTQMHYILELDLPPETPPREPAQEAAPPGPQSTSLEALKSLLSTTGHWHDFAHLELQGAWKLFDTIHTYPKGVCLLARAMVQSHCKQIKAVLNQLLPSLRSPQERERKAAILILTEFLYSPALLEVLPQQAALTVLGRGLRDPSCEVRVLSLQGLGNILFCPEKGSLLRGQLPAFLDGFFQNSELMVVRIMGTVSDVLHRLGMQGAGAQTLGVAINARSFFDDERDAIRAAAMALFGDLVAVMADREPSSLQTQVHQSMVPLLLHLKDECPAVATQAKYAFYRCALLLRWQLPHTLFCTLAWERGLSARHFLWTCLMTHSQEEFSIHLSQAISYLHSRHHHIKMWAALFIG
uniref:Maestro heat like repeat family member 5 (gene/pseudogene) n=1 Tax=Otolemur garnettii TaxID=30611 RepID=H0XK01_OTOGA